jgi:hypothetical protein
MIIFCLLAAFAWFTEPKLARLRGFARLRRFAASARQPSRV